MLGGRLFLLGKMAFRLFEVYRKDIFFLTMKYCLNFRVGFLNQILNVSSGKTLAGVISMKNNFTFVS